MSHDPASPSGNPSGAGSARPSSAAGRVVPVYAVTGGRTRSTGADLAIESLVTLPIVLPPTVIGFYLRTLFAPEKPLGRVSWV